MMKIAIFDDYQNVALQTGLPSRHELMSLSLMITWPTRTHLSPGWRRSKRSA
jgi:hypothetical protein